MKMFRQKRARLLNIHENKRSLLSISVRVYECNKHERAGW